MVREEMEGGREGGRDDGWVGHGGFKIDELWKSRHHCCWKHCCY